MIDEDIVAGLRERVAWHIDEQEGEHSGSDYIEWLAADEIERLREQLRLSNIDAVNTEARANDAEARLRAVVEIAGAWQSSSGIATRILDAAGYERCKRCGGSGMLRDMPDGAGMPADCDCIDGWREVESE